MDKRLASELSQYHNKIGFTRNLNTKHNTTNEIRNFSHYLILFSFSVKLNGGRSVNGILRGFDPFMNLVLDETIEDCKDGNKKNIGMVVSSFVLHCCTFIEMYDITSGN